MADVSQKQGLGSAGDLRLVPRLDNLRLYLFALGELMPELARAVCDAFFELRVERPLAASHPEQQQGRKHQGQTCEQGR